MDSQNNTHLDQPAIPALIAGGFIPALLAAYLVVTSGWSLLPSLDQYDGKRVLEIAVISVSLLFGLVYRPLRTQAVAIAVLIPRPVQIAILMVFALGLLSASTSDHAFYGLTEVSLYFSMFVLVFFIAASAQLLGERMLTLVAVFLLLLGTLVCLTEFIGLLVHWQHGQSATSHTLFVRFSHPRFFNQIQSWLLPLMLLPLLAFSGKKLLAGIAIFNLAFWWALLIYSGGRGSLLGLVCAFGFVFLLVYKNSHFSRWRNLYLLVLVAGIGIYLVLVMIPILLGGDTSEIIAGSTGRAISHTSGRFYYWQIVLQSLAEHPVLGTGPGLSACVGPITYFAHPHNFYLQLAGEWGVPAGLLAASVIIHVLRSVAGKLWHCLDEQESVLIIIVATGALAAGIHAMFSGVMVMPASQVCCVLVFGYLTSLLLRPTAIPLRQGDGKESAARRPVIVMMLVLPICFAVVQLGYFVFTELPQLESRADTFVEKYAAPYSPRLWQHGNICSFEAQTP